MVKITPNVKSSLFAQAIWKVRMISTRYIPAANSILISPNDFFLVKSSFHILHALPSIAAFIFQTTNQEEVF